MGIHNESTYARFNALEAEMCRRLWWSLIIFDNRICEMSKSNATMLAPTWNCRTPLNVNDHDLQPEMKSPPIVHDRPTEAFFAVVRSELGEFVRHSVAHLDFTNPSLKDIAKDARHTSDEEASGLTGLEKTMEDKYLRFCSPENPLHYVTIWTARGYIAKNRLLELYSRHSRSSVQHTDIQQDAAVSYAVRMLECDTKLNTSPLTKGYSWYTHLNFPFPAYIHIVQDLRKRPLGKHADDAWTAMSCNYESRVYDDEEQASIFHQVFSGMLIQAWRAREVAFGQLGKPLEPPRIVLAIKQVVIQTASNAQTTDVQQPNATASINTDDFPIHMPMDFGGNGLQYGMGGQAWAAFGSQGYSDISGQGVIPFDSNQQDWTTIDWNTMHGGW